MTQIKLVNGGTETVLWDGISKTTPDLIPIAENIRARSITPTTFLERTFDSDITSTWFKDTYQHNGNSVVRFGISTTSPHIRAIVESDKIKIVEPSPGSARTYAPDDAKKIIISSVENEVLHRAVQHLLTTLGTNTVLVDIVERNTTPGPNFGSAIFKESVPKTHTVVLCNNQTNAAGAVEILAIDPNNFTFSCHLSNFTMANYAVPFVIKTINKAIQIYKPEKDQGPDHKQFRDCGDVAAKIAFAFQEMHRGNSWQPIHDEKDITQSIAIQHISNVPTVDQHFLTRKPVPLRVKQSSDMKLVKHFNGLEKLVDLSNDQSEALLKGQEFSEMMDRCLQILRDTTSDKILQELFAYNKFCIQRMDETVDTLKAMVGSLQGDHESLHHDIYG